MAAKFNLRGVKASNSTNKQPHGTPHTPQPWDAKQAAAQAAKHNAGMERIQKLNDKGR